MRPARGLLPALLKLWLATLRVRFHGPLPERGVLMLWHEDLPACMRAFARHGIHVLISQSRDGGLAAELCGRLGYRVVRGSSSRGALSGMKALARALERGGLAGMALDGPRGPAHLPKPGTLWLARRAGLPVYPIRVRARHAFRLTTWDRTRIPLPFSRIDVELGPPAHPETLRGLHDLRAAMDRPDSANRLGHREQPAGIPAGRGA